MRNGRRETKVGGGGQRGERGAGLRGSCLMLGLLALAGRAGADDSPLYNRDIRPILADACFACHGPDSASRKADLRLDRRDDALANEAIVPGKPDDSELIARILSDDPEQVMPPPSTKKVLTAEQKGMLKAWIAKGAEYQPHWSLIAPLRPAVPEVRRKEWVKTPVDAFVLAKLEREGLEPAAEADRRTLARRLSLDLTGLPPEPALVEEFVADQSPDAYEKLVDRLQAMPQWGEHRARYWLDAARYADTHGIHFDNYREMWSYRDWVIGAFNRNLPFDQFTIEQLAGDLLPDATLDQRIASGFNRCNITTNEGGVIAEEYLVLYTRDRTETTSQVWMGLTAGCAVCHDHKFDPLSQHEFYSLAAFFNNTTQGAMDGNIRDTPPIIPVPLPNDRERFAAVEKELNEARQLVAARRTEARPAFETWLAGASAESLLKGVPKEGLELHAGFTEGAGKQARVVVAGEERTVALAENVQWIAGPGTSKAVQVQGQGAEFSEVGNYEKDQAFSCAAWVRLQANDSSGAIASRMDVPPAYQGWDFWVQGRRIGMHIISAWSNDALKVVAQAQVPGNEWTHVAVTYDGSGKAAGVKVYYNGKPQGVNVEQDRLSGSIKTLVPFKIGQRSGGDPLSAGGIQDLRMYGRSLAPAEVEALANAARFEAVLLKKAEERTEAEKNDLYNYWLGSEDDEFQARTKRVLELEGELGAIRSRGTVAHVMQERGEPAMAFVLQRGEYDKRRDPVTPNTPAVLPKFPDELPKNRLGFAQWLLRPEHPLTGRVTVNRIWQELFGTGIVRTAGDFGVTGELPSDPELLDWLAVEFRESGWDVKKLYKLLVMSSAYRQGAVATAEKLHKDPQNRLISRGPRFRMDAEMVRDYALSASGLLVKTIGGPSVKPYQPDGVWEAVAMIGSNTRDYRRDSGDNLYRRSMYWMWKRSAPPASMDVFNAPSREMCTVRRDRTNTPLQALVTLNDPQFVEAARKLAERTLLEVPGGDAERMQFVAARVLARPFREAELKVVEGSLKDLREYYFAHEKDAQQLLTVGEAAVNPAVDAKELAAWTMLANQLLNLDEVLNK